MRVEGKPERKAANEIMDICPECGSWNVDEEYVNCLCHRTYEGNGITCWTAPKCYDCGYLGAGNSSGGLWYMPDEW